MSSSSLTPLTPNFSPKDYSIFFASGALCCTVTHGMMTPIDVIKTRIQIDPALSRQGMLSAGRQIVAKEGMGGLLTGSVLGLTFSRFAARRADKPRQTSLYV